MEKIKTIGDAYMAICGAPDLNAKPEDTSPINSIHVSHEFYKALSNQTGFNLRKGTKLKGLGEKDTYSFSSNHKISD